MKINPAIAPPRIDHVTRMLDVVAKRKIQGEDLTWVHTVDRDREIAIESLSRELIANNFIECHTYKKMLNKITT